MRTIPSLEVLLKDFVEDVIRFIFIPVIAGGHLCSDNDHILLSLPARFDEHAIPLSDNDAKCEYESSRKLTLSLTHLIKDRYQIYSVNETELKSIQASIKRDKEEQYEETLTEFQTHLNENQKSLNDITQEKGVSKCLMPYPISDQVYNLKKQQFWDCVCFREGWRLTNIHVVVVPRWASNMP